MLCFVEQGVKVVWDKIVLLILSTRFPVVPKLNGLPHYSALSSYRTVATVAVARLNWAF